MNVHDESPWLDTCRCNVCTCNPSWISKWYLCLCTWCFREWWLADCLIPKFYWRHCQIPEQLGHWISLYIALIKFHNRTPVLHGHALLWHWGWVFGSRMHVMLHVHTNVPTHALLKYTKPDISSRPCFGSSTVYAVVTHYTLLFCLVEFCF